MVTWKNGLMHKEVAELRHDPTPRSDESLTTHISHYVPEQLVWHALELSFMA